jgi:hypothetical protein
MKKRHSTCKCEGFKKNKARVSVSDSSTARVRVRASKRAKEFLRKEIIHE